MSQTFTKFKRWFWSAKVQDQFRSTTVDILWIAFTLADGNLFDLIVALASGNMAGLTVSGVALVVTRVFIRAIAFYILKKAKTLFPHLALPRDFAVEEPTSSQTRRMSHT